MNYANVILVTATVNPFIVNVKLLDPVARRIQYLSALEWLMASVASRLDASEWSIVFVENSGQRLDSEIARLTGRYAIPVEILGFNQCEKDEFRGNIGNAEIDIYRHAIVSSRFIRTANRIVKITGRYIVPNFWRVMADKCGDNACISFYPRCFYLGRRTGYLTSLYSMSSFSFRMWVQYLEKKFLIENKSLEFHLGDWLNDRDDLYSVRIEYPKIDSVSGTTNTLICNSGKERLRYLISDVIPFGVTWKDNG